MKVLMGAFSIFTLLLGSISFASEPIIQDDFHQLKNLGYSGKGVSVGILDMFLPSEDGSSHGLEVAKFIHAAAPDARIITEDLTMPAGDSDAGPLMLYNALAPDIRDFHLTSFCPSSTLALRANGLSEREREALCRKSPSLELYAASPARYPHYDLVTFERGASFTFTRNENADIFFFRKNGQAYAVSVYAIASEGHFYWHFKGEELLSILKRSMPNLIPFKQKISNFMQQGVKLINASISFYTDYEDALGSFWQSGGVFVQSVANIPFKLGDDKINFRRLFDVQSIV